MESIKQEIINNIYENGEQLITGPILQEVLLDMVDDVNDKVASASAAIPGDLVEKTGSWDDAADWVEQNSSSVVLQPDLDGYATEQWVEDQGYLKEVPEGYATTESLNDLSESVAQDFSNLDIPDTSGLATTESVNQLSESVAQSIADIPEVDLSGYATTASVNEATESVKEWVEAKHYLTTASLSGSVTEETVGFMINDATASVKDWVESQSYATEQWVEEQGYLKEHQDISGLATTESVTSLSESVAQDFANLNIPDVSGLATTESVSQLSESVASDFANLDIPDVSGLATTESVSNLSESVAETIANIPQADLSGYLTTASYTTDSASFDERISAITGSDLSGYATTESLNSLSESVAQSIADIPGVDLSGYATTSSVNEATASVKDWVQEQGYLTEHQDISGLATTESVNQLSESIAQTIEDLPQVDLNGYVTTASYNTDSASFDQRINDIPVIDPSEYVTTQSYNLDSASFDERINAITGSDLSGYATTASLNELSESVAGDIESLNNTLDGISQGVEEVSNSLANYATTESVNQISESFAETIANIPTGSTGDLSGYATTASVNSLSESVASDFESLNNTVDGINVQLEEISGSLPNYLTTESANQLSASFDERISAITGSDLSGYATTESVNSVSESIAGDIESLTNSLDGVSQGVEEVSNSLANYATTESVSSLSASFDQRINDITGSGDPVDPIWVRGTGSGSAVLSGSTSTATGQFSVAEGFKTTASAQYSHAEGNSTFASGNYSHAEGYATKAWGVASHAEGLHSTASGDYSHAEGRGTRAINTGEHAEGKYNATASNQIFSIGAGSSNTDRKNVVSIITGSDPSASVYIYGVGTYDGTNPQPGINDVATLINAGGGSGADTSLRNFLFGTDTQVLTRITGSVTNIYTSISSDATLGFGVVPDRGRSLGITIHNIGSSSVTVTLPATVTVDGTTYNLINNGVKNSGSMSIPSGEYGDIVVTRNGSGLFVRTSIDVSSISGSSAPVDLSGYATTASLISTTDPSNSAALFLESIKNIIHWDEWENAWVADGVTTDGEGGFDNAPTIIKYLVEYGIVSYEEEYDEVTGEPTHWYVQWGVGDAEWDNNTVMNLLRNISNGSGEGNTLVEWEQLSEDDGTWYSPIVRDFYGYGQDPGISASFVSTSASFDQRINNIITGSGVDLSGYATTASVLAISESLSQSIAAIPGSDLSGYATTESVNNLSSSVGDISSSFAETIANIPTGSSGNYLPLTGGTLSGALRVNSSVGVGTAPKGIYSLAVGNSSTNTNNAHYSLAVGEDCSTSVYGGVALGRETRVEGNGAFGTATGFRTRVEAMAGYAGGCRATASANFAFAAGFGAEAASLGQVVLGSYNVVDRSNGTGSYAVILGNGKSSTWNQDNPGDITRSNGLAIKWDGGIDINYSGSTITLQDKIAELEQGGGGSPVDLSGYATTESVNTLSASFDQRINNITSSTALQDFLFGIGSASIDSLDCSVTNIYCSESANNSIGFVSVPEEGRSIAVDIQNTGNSSITISISDSYTLDQVEYTLITNGIGNVATQTLTIPSGQHGNIVIMRRGTDLFLRTSITLTDYEAIFSRLASLEARVEALESN